MTKMNQPFSETHLGFVVAGLAGTLTGGPFGAIASPVVLHLANKQIEPPSSDVKFSKRWLTWAGIGLLGAPFCLCTFGLAMIPFTDSTKSTNLTTRESSKTDIAKTVPESKSQPEASQTLKGWNARNEVANPKEAVPEIKTVAGAQQVLMTTGTGRVIEEKLVKIMMSNGLSKEEAVAAVQAASSALGKPSNLNVAGTVEVAKPSIIKSNFTTTKKFVGDPSEITNGEALLNKDQGYTEWYSEIKGGAYAGYRYMHRCYKDGRISETEKLKNYDWEISDGVRCDVQASNGGVPSKFRLIDTSDGYVSQVVVVDSAKPAVAATPVFVPDQTATTIACKNLAKQNSVTGDVSWNAFGTGDPRWWSGSGTIILSGRTKNAFGTKMPFTIECQNNKGTVRIVEITR